MPTCSTTLIGLRQMMEKPDYRSKTDIECSESNLLGGHGVEVSFSPNFSLGEGKFFMALMFRIIML